ncbi:hypothetical protein [uncultured Cohaesibacter sp.]|uniref:hypothetical protein n=1 Tax=uncultured Cohaesibacter sp. TaxID=1002546 RepID=UPI002AABFCA0|nr:hypothetical protein [uncultured Cohaesibacter sp.]
MRIITILPTTLLMCVSLFGLASAAPAQDIVASIAGSEFFCEGGNESSGRAYKFKVEDGSVMRIDRRFPDKEVVFQIGRASKGQLGEYWSYETLSDKRDNRLHLYERVSMRSPDQSRHIYTTYELYKDSQGVNMVLYNGVNGARDWTQKTVRDCGYMVGDKVMRKGNRYWSTTFAR